MRYYAHYTFIYPDKLLTNFIVELDADLHLISVFPYEKEISRTVFHSGLQIFLPVDLLIDDLPQTLFKIKPELKELSVDWNDVLIRRFRV